MAPVAPIDLDHFATTPLDPRVLDAMLPVLRDQHGNPGSNHAGGWAADALVEQARARVAAAVGAEPAEIVFTSGATESLNLALQGFAAARGRPGHLVTTVLEHAAVRETVAALVCRGWEATTVACDAEGIVPVDALAAALRDDTALIAMTAAQNEIGTVQPWAAVAAAGRARGVPLLIDAAQAAGKLPLDVRADGPALVALSSHKLHGPKGVGALVVRRREPRPRLAPLLHGGGQEGGLRSGTPNVAGIVGMGEAYRLAAAERKERTDHLRALASRLHLAVAEGAGDLRFNGCARRRLPGTLHWCIPGVRSDRLRRALPTLRLSAGSACGPDEPASPVLAALGLDPDAQACCVRVALGKDTTAAEVDEAAARIVAAVRRLRG